MQKVSSTDSLWDDCSSSVSNSAATKKEAAEEKKSCCVTMAACCACGCFVSMGSAIKAFFTPAHYFPKSENYGSFEKIVRETKGVNKE